MSEKFNIEKENVPITEIQKLKIKNNYINNLKKGIKDLSHLKTYTIDDSDTLEVDDGISLERNSNFYKLWIHIASPALLIEYDSDIDRNARKQISSIYLSTTNIYMFPSDIIDKILSLSSKQKSLSLSLGVTFNNDGSICSSEIVQSLVKSTYKLTYEEADELIDYAPREEDDLNIIYFILEKRKLWRKKLGAREILESYGKIVINNNKPYLKVIEQTISRNLISEAMILYGDLLANYTKKYNIPVPYRVQENTFKASNNNNSENIILNNFIVKKNMGKTYYSSIPSAHVSLGLNSYLHATSPIRRYADLLVHYQINRFLNNQSLISKKEIDNNIKIINNIGRQNINRYREDQKICINKWFENNLVKKFKVMLLNWLNRNNNICILYFLEYNFSTICNLKSKLEITVGDEFYIENTTFNYKDILNFKFVR
tara:strand:- start:1426 stop:2715 length:1290 start_codon:yes stop_codon:yes gene_type:complete